eukprot:jgi/Chlat1/2744/Chrsp187S02928
MKDSNQDGLSPVANTSRLIAAARAVETLDHPHPLFHDPLAAYLAGKEALARARERCQHNAANNVRMPVRTKYFDDAVVKALRGEMVEVLREEQGEGGVKRVRQVGMLGAGMDARAWRLPEDRREGEGWLADTLFEVDQAEVLAAKEAILKQVHDSGALDITLTLAEKRVPVTADLSDPSWTSKLRSKGFDASAPTAWVADLSVQGSIVIASVQTEESIARAQQSDSPVLRLWKFGTSDPAAYFGQRGWRVTSDVECGSETANYGRFDGTAPEQTNTTRTHYVCAVRTKD